MGPNTLRGGRWTCFGEFKRAGEREMSHHGAVAQRVAIVTECRSNLNVGGILSGRCFERFALSRGLFLSAEIQFLAVRQARILASCHVGSPSARILAWRTSRNQDLGAPQGGSPNLRFSPGTHVPKILLHALSCSLRLFFSFSPALLVQMKRIMSELFFVLVSSRCSKTTFEG